jgi:serine/threonine protein phosphatase 1
LSTWFEELDLSDKANVYAVGDIHGRFNALDKCLEEIGFNKERDFLISVGDLVDRGDSNERCIEFIGQPWFKHIIGNHEVMSEQMIRGESFDNSINGGGWLKELDHDLQHKIVDALMDTCHILEVKTPSGLHCGFIHADTRLKKWSDIRMTIDTRFTLWERETVRNMRNPDYDVTIEGIDKVFFGHNAMYRPVHRDNCYWIDTGSGFSDGHLTLINIDTDRIHKEYK